MLFLGFDKEFQIQHFKTSKNVSIGNLFPIHLVWFYYPKQIRVFRLVINFFLEIEWRQKYDNKLEIMKV